MKNKDKPTIKVSIHHSYTDEDNISVYYSNRDPGIDVINKVKISDINLNYGYLI